MKENLKLIKYVHEVHEIKNEINDNSDNELDLSDEDNKNRSHTSHKNECEYLVKLIENIISFSLDNKILIIYMQSSFWEKIINEYNIPNFENIDNIYNFRRLYMKYHKLINDLYIKDTESKEKYNTIKNDINRFYEKDEFAFILNKNIKNFLEEKSNSLRKIEKLCVIEQFNPYYSIRYTDDMQRYKNMRETYIFDYIDFNQNTQSFIKTFKHLNFETIFEENIIDYINKLTEKIKDIKTFGNIIHLIEVNRIKKEKQSLYFNILKKKYKNIFENEIKLIKNEYELNQAIKIIAEFIGQLFIYEKNNNFLIEEISKLDEKIKSLIYIELLTTYKDEKYKNLINFIYDIYVKNINTKKGREDIINFLKKLPNKEKNYFIFEKLLEECIFTKEEFFSPNENYKIKTLCYLNKELKKESEKFNILKQSINGNKSAKNLVNLLDGITLDLEKGKILKKDLENFLKLKKPQKKEKDENENKGIKKDENENEIDKNNIEDITEKLELISLVLINYDPIAKYSRYKHDINLINEKIEKLNYIKDSLMIFVHYFILKRKYFMN